MIKFTFSDCYWVKCGLTAFSSFVFCRISYFDNYLTFEIFTEHIKRTACQQLRTFCDDVKPFLSLLRVKHHQKKAFSCPRIEVLLPQWPFLWSEENKLWWINTRHEMEGSVWPGSALTLTSPTDVYKVKKHCMSREKLLGWHVENSLF